MKVWNKDKLLSLMPIVQAVKGLSKDPNTKIGAMIIDEDYTIRSIGYNGLPRKVNEAVALRHSRINEEKYYWYEHAERNALYNALRTHTDIRNCHMLLTCDIPCCDCARGIIQSMQKSVIIVSEGMGTGSNLKWEQHAIRSSKMFAEAGVKVTYINDL